jgi:carbonic anhydrase/acetyltransferase-like protein (isoleucine patch superfamily)
MGTPAKVVRPLTPEQIERLSHNARSYQANAQRYAAGLKRLA